MVHVLALTDSGEVYAWGKKEYAQMGDVSISDEPTFIPALSSAQVIGIAAGPTQVNSLSFLLKFLFKKNIKFWLF